MLIDLKTLVEKYNIVFKGILHVGAHDCEEIVAYDNYVPRSKVLWIDALPDKVEQCKLQHSNICIEHAAVSDVVEMVTFNRSNNGQSSSILELGLHKNFYPHIYYTESFQIETKVLRDILPKYDISCNFLNLDIQGVELKALKGMSEYLPNVDYIYTEVNSDYIYVGCAIVEEIDDYLKQYGLERVETVWTDEKWGDAFYIRRHV